MYNISSSYQFKCILRTVSVAQSGTLLKKGSANSVLMPRSSVPQGWNTPTVYPFRLMWSVATIQFIAWNFRHFQQAILTVNVMDFSIDLHANKKMSGKIPSM